MGKTVNVLSSTLVFILLFLCTSQTIHSQHLSQSDKNDIISVLKFQESKWNEGDINGYMEGYLHSDSLKFITKNGITYGWQNTLEKYKKSYPNKTAMGNLQFDVIKIEALCENKAIMTGKWTLTLTSSKNLNKLVVGYFTLIWQKFNGKWFIIIDHTS